MVVDNRAFLFILFLLNVPYPTFQSRHLFRRTGDRHTPRVGALRGWRLRRKLPALRWYQNVRWPRYHIGALRISGRRFSNHCSAGLSVFRQLSSVGYSCAWNNCRPTCGMRERIAPFADSFRLAMLSGGDVYGTVCPHYVDTFDAMKCV